MQPLAAEKLPGYSAERKAIEAFMKLCEFGGLGPMCPRCGQYPKVLVFDGTSLRNMHIQEEVENRNIAHFVQPQPGCTSRRSYPLYHFMPISAHRKLLLQYLRTESSLRPVFPLHDLSELPQEVLQIISLFHTVSPAASSDGGSRRFAELLHQNVHPNYHEVRSISGMCSI